MVLGCAVFFAFGEPFSVQAGDYRAFRDALAGASANMRGAAFYLRTKNAMVAGFELDALEAAWKPFVERYANDPPDIFAADPNWRATLEAVSGNLASARAATANGDIAAARDGVNAMRKSLAELRRRNGVYAFEDCVEEMRDAFGRLYVYRRKPPDFKSPEQVGRVKAAAAIAEYVYRRCYATAPAAYHGDGMFERQFGQAFNDFKELSPAIARGNTRDFIDLLRRIISYQNLIFLRFG